MRRRGSTGRQSTWPRLPGPVNDLASIYSIRKNYPEAERLYRKATELDPAQGIYHANLALCLLNANRRGGGTTEAKQAITLGYTGRHPAFKRLGLNP